MFITSSCTGFCLLLLTHFSATSLLLQNYSTLWHIPHRAEWWGTGVVICLELGADLHMAQLMPLPLPISCFIKIQIGYTFLVPAHPGSPGKRAVKWVCVAHPPNNFLDNYRKFLQTGCIHCHQKISSVKSTEGNSRH